MCPLIRSAGCHLPESSLCQDLRGVSKPPHYQNSHKLGHAEWWILIGKQECVTTNPHCPAKVSSDEIKKPSRIPAQDQDSPPGNEKENRGGYFYECQHDHMRYDHQSSEEGGQSRKPIWIFDLQPYRIFHSSPSSLFYLLPQPLPHRLCNKPRRLQKDFGDSLGLILSHPNIKGKTDYAATKCCFPHSSCSAFANTALRDEVIPNPS